MPTGTFYNGATSKDFVGPEASMKCSIHYWTDHGIAGRGVLIDYRSYAHKKDIEYDPFERYAITWQELYNCGKDQGIDIRPEAQGGDIKVGDMLFIRSGFVEKYNTSPAEVRKEAALRGFGDHTNEQHQWAGVAQGDEMLDWIHDCYFSTVAGDAPAFEVWPKFTEQFLHEYILSLWGIPLGEMLDLEKLSELCKKNNRWTFFVTSAPANVPGGVASHVNGIAIF
ncbi:hypothetical protein MMC25_006159 [Agyrium rufum]|nr:hypothetical protein [Agyrium rufum]